MKEKITAILLLFLFSTLIGVLMYSFYDNSRLNNVIEDQNEFIKEVTGKESDFAKESKKYRDSLTSYTNEIKYLLDGKTITSNQFINAYEKLSKRNDSLNTELDNLKFIHSYVKKLYGFDVKVMKTDSTISISALPYTRADSAKVALDNFHDRLKRIKNGWEVNITGPREIKKANDQIRKTFDKNKLIDTPVIRK